MTLLDDTEDQIVVDPNKNYLEELVGEGKKFKTVEDLAKGKFYADQTVEIMKKRQDELRADYLKEREQNITRAQLEEVIDRLSKKQLASSEQPQANEEKMTPAYDPAQLESLVASNYQKMKAQEREENNYNSVKEKLTERYGTEYKTVLTKQMADLGLSAEEVDSMARKNPNVFIKAFGLDQAKNQDTFQPPMKSSIQGFAPTGNKQRTWSWYQDLKKNQPKVYHDQRTQQQMMDDYALLGDKFEDGTFHQS